MHIWQALKPRYDAHFIPVKYTGKNHCVSGKPLWKTDSSGKPLPKDADFQAAVAGTTAPLPGHQCCISNSNTARRERCYRARASGWVGKACAAGGGGVVEEEVMRIVASFIAELLQVFLAPHLIIKVGCGTTCAASRTIIINIQQMDSFIYLHALTMRQVCCCKMLV